jgi:hypothetical protein
MSSLLVHHEAVPLAAREALRAAAAGHPDARLALLERAAGILYRDAGMECRDARELVDLSPARCG